MAEGSPGKVHTYVKGAALWVVLDRPAALNALTTSMYEALHRACLRAEEADDIRCVVITGARGDRPAFAAGSDISSMAACETWADYQAYEDGVLDIIRTIQRLRVPTIAAVAGPCVGAGATIALSCDLRVVAQSARLGYPIARSTGGCLPTETYVLLAAHLGMPRAVDMLLTARLMNAEQIGAAGLASKVVDDAELDEATQDLADRIVSLAPLSLRAAKAEMWRLRDRLCAGAADDLRPMVFESDDFKEGIDAFVAGRAPVWTGK
ncbi:enoyl-CoA hydratase-related protein [Spirillospora sp. CA-255316]